MKILLINSNRLLPPVFPVGLTYIATVAKEAGHDVKILDLNLPRENRGKNESVYQYDNVDKAITEAIREYSPDVIGISIRNIDNVTMVRSAYYIPAIKKIADKCKEISNAPIVLGGPGFSMMPKEIMAEIDVPYGVIGEGERAFPALLAWLDKSVATSIDIPGVIYKDGDTFIRNNYKNMTSPELNERQFPNLDIFNTRLYCDFGGMANLQTKRGCDRKCTYCTYPVIEGRRYRYRSPAKVVDEIVSMQEEGVKYIHLSDSTFNIPNWHAIGICKEMVKRGVKIKWTPYMSPFEPSKELLELCIETGCDGIVYGSDSLSDKMLVSMRKGFTLKDIEKCAELCNELELPYSFNILFGAPGETKETVRESLANIERIKPVAVGAMIGVRCYPKTQIWKSAIKQGVITQKTNLLEPFYYTSPTIDREWLINTVTEYNKNHDNFFSPRSEEGPHTNELIMEIYKDGIRGPFWEIYGEFIRRAKAKKTQK